ncbi:MAG TPA: fatty acyl-AMP ligase, partial [Caldilineae bacterium]|nr:fatty acyl-AMP ligase [Caldilineae bacterium]
FGCLYAGAIAVPAYPPNPMRLDRTLPRLQRIVSDAQPRVALTTEPILAMTSFVFTQAPDLAALQWLPSDTIAAGAENGWVEPDVGTDTLAFLQYTSGSTQAPRGVMLTHGNLMHNFTLASQAFGLARNEIGVIWLPPYHDMGLIGGILQPVYIGATCVLFSPLSFLQRPFRWLDAVSRYKATVSGGPNFAYDLSARKVTPDQLSGLDFSHWRVAFNGAEPVRKDTMDRFAEAFAPCGFQPQAFYPCYGLAEATLIVSGGSQSDLPVVFAVEKGTLEQNRPVEVAEDDPDAQLLVGCGKTLGEQTVLIVDPDSLIPRPDGEVGEIWVKGPSIAQGYWNNDEETARTFGAYLADGSDGPFLRTGDLGLLRDGELFVTGRIKDLIIIDGLNHYPQDIEYTVENLHPAMRPGCSAAFSVPVDGNERLVVAAEVRKQYKPLTADADTSKGMWLDAEDLKKKIRRAITENHDLRTYDIVLLKAGTIPKTSSGKIQRHTTRAAYLAETLEIWDA